MALGWPAIALQIAARSLVSARAAGAPSGSSTSGPAPRSSGSSLGFDALAADVYWIRALQHYGGDRLTGKVPGAKYELLYPLLDITTTLDPYFTIAYRFGAIFLSEGYPGGPGRPDQSVALLRKALVAMPQKWQYYHDIGFVYYWHLRDYQSAATWFRRAAAQPGAPNWLEPLAASMLTRGQGPRRGAVPVAADPEVRGGVAAAQRRARAGAARRARPDRSARRASSSATRRRPASPTRGPRSSGSGVGSRGVPADPTGTPFDLDPATGRVTVSPQSSLFPMPETEPRQLQ